MSRSVALIVNPASNGGRSAKVVPGVVEKLRLTGSDVVVHQTRSLRHASELGAQAVAEGRVALAMGGDGLVSAVATAVADARPSGILGVIPNGRGNDLARWLGIGSVEIALAAIDGGVERAIDLGFVNGQAFALTASIGFDSDVLAAAERTRLVKGAAVYPYATLKSLARWKPVDFSLKLDGVERDFTGFNVVVANGGSYGGGMKIAPHASVDDGYFDVVTIAAVPRLTFLRIAPQIFSGGHIDHPAVQVSKAKEVSVTTSRPFPVCIDGEIAGSGPLAARIRPLAVRVLVP